MKRLFAVFSSKEFIKFLLVGGFAAVVNFFSRIILSDFFIFSVAILIAYVIGMIVAFLLNKLLVFKNVSHSTSRQAFYFVLVNVIGVVQTLLVSITLVQFIFPFIHFNLYNEVVAHFIGICIPAFTSYLGHKYYSFAKM